MKYCKWSIKCELKCKKRNYLKSEILKSNYCDFNHAYIQVRGNITVMGVRTTQVLF